MARVEADLAPALYLPAGEFLALRAVTPDDAEALQAYVRALSPPRPVTIGSSAHYRNCRRRNSNA
jgi:hypothetical protein